MLRTAALVVSAGVDIMHKALLACLWAFSDGIISKVHFNLKKKKKRKMSLRRGNLHITIVHVQDTKRHQKDKRRRARQGSKRLGLLCCNLVDTIAHFESTALRRYGSHRCSLPACTHTSLIQSNPVRLMNTKK